MQEKEDDLLTSSQVAEIWNERAKRAGYKRRYSRRIVNYHCTHPEDDPALKPAMVTPIGNFFTRKAAWEFPITPHIGRPLEDAA